MRASSAPTARIITRTDQIVQRLLQAGARFCGQPDAASAALDRGCSSAWGPGAEQRRLLPNAVSAAPGRSASESSVRCPEGGEEYDAILRRPTGNPNETVGCAYAARSRLNGRRTARVRSSAPEELTLARDVVARQADAGLAMSQSGADDCSAGDLASSLASVTIARAQGQPRRISAIARRRLFREVAGGSRAGGPRLARFNADAGGLPTGQIWGSRAA